MNNQPNPVEVLQGIAVMQAVTLGFLIGSQVILNRRLQKFETRSNLVNVFTQPLPAVPETVVG